MQAARRHRSWRQGAQRAFDVVGLTLWLALTCWVLLVARSQLDAAPMWRLLLAAALAHVLARALGRWSVLIVPWSIVLCAGTVAAFWTLQAVVSPQLLRWQVGGYVGAWLLRRAPAFGAAMLWWRDPLGYANATAALTLVGAAASLVVAARTTGGMRRVALGIAALCAVAPALHDAQAAALLATALIVLFAVSDGRPPVRLVVRCAVVAVLVVLCATVAIGIAYNGLGTPDRLVGGTLSGNRALLWGDALDQVASAPVTGVGVNRFSQVSPVALRNADLRWTHQELLQLAAETGLPGLALGLALVLWALVRPAVGPRDAGTAFVVAGVAAVGVAAQIDYIWHFPVVALATAALTGCGRGDLAAVGDVDHLLGYGEPGVLTARAGDALGSQQP